MPETSPIAAPAPHAGRSLVARVIGVVVSPYETYADVAAWPKVLGVLLFVVVLSATATAVFSSSRRGREIVLDQAIASVRQLESLGVRMPDEAYAQMEKGI